MLGFWILRGTRPKGRAMVRRRWRCLRFRSELAQAHALYVGAGSRNQSDYGEAQQMLETCLALRRRLG
jgi:hypothetical protein